MSDHPSEDHGTITIGALLFDQVDQIDFTGPFEVLSRLPDSKFHVIGKSLAPVRDVNGLLLTPEMTLEQAPPLDLLVVPGGRGQQRLMEDEVVLEFLRRQASGARYIFSVCTGALLCGAAGLLRGARATTHWSAWHLLPCFGAIPVEARVVVDGRHVSASGVTAGIDGALHVAALFRGDDVARQIQLAIEYAPEPPFDCGTPNQAPKAILEAARAAVKDLTDERLATAQRVARRLGIPVADLAPR